MTRRRSTMRRLTELQSRLRRTPRAHRIFTMEHIRFHQPKAALHDTHIPRSRNHRPRPEHWPSSPSSAAVKRPGCSTLRRSTLGTRAEEPDEPFLAGEPSNHSRGCGNSRSDRCNCGIDRRSWLGRPPPCSGDRPGACRRRWWVRCPHNPWPFQRSRAHSGEPAHAHRRHRCRRGQPVPRRRGR